MRYLLLASEGRLLPIPTRWGTAWSTEMLGSWIWFVYWGSLNRPGFISWYLAFWDEFTWISTTAYRLALGIHVFPSRMLKWAFTSNSKPRVPNHLGLNRVTTRRRDQYLGLDPPVFCWGSVDRSPKSVVSSFILHNPTRQRRLPGDCLTQAPPSRWGSRRRVWIPSDWVRDLTGEAGSFVHTKL